MSEGVFYFDCLSEQDTQKLAQKISLIAERGDVFALYGTLGAGKSVFARAFIQNLTKAQEVPSPTFTLVQSYQAQRFDIYHFDLYRLKSEEEIWELNIEEAMYQNVSLIEWPEKMKGYLPSDVFKIFISTKADGSRQIKFETISEEKKERLKTIKRG